jgi:transcriptional regulator with XRE-family HTH domain
VPRGKDSSQKFKSLFTGEYECFRMLLRDARIKSGLSQEELALRINQTQLFVSRSEIGDRKVDIIELFVLCEALNIPFIEFLQRLEDEIVKSRREARRNEQA